MSIPIQGVSGVQKLWSIVALLSVIGMFTIALPRLSPASLYTGEGLFSLAWLVLAGGVLISHGLELRKRRGHKKRVATVSLRPPKTIGQVQQNERQQRTRSNA